MFRIIPTTKAIGQIRSMATLKESRLIKCISLSILVSLRLKSIQNIAKITKSMKMIASTKVAKAQRTMEQARIYGAASSGNFLKKFSHTII